MGLPVCVYVNCGSFESYESLIQVHIHKLQLRLRRSSVSMFYIKLISFQEFLFCSKNKKELRLSIQCRRLVDQTNY